ncbi:hypothetical protein G3M53_61825, partial [Streptomyces sp. SID7982]|nr:hypothetical protein [Streptomyces sp. SID7982]
LLCGDTEGAQDLTRTTLGKGRPAPAMMQQIDGLKGCVANAWPYDAKGRYLGGPKVPVTPASVAVSGRGAPAAP